MEKASREAEEKASREAAEKASREAEEKAASEAASREEAARQAAASAARDYIANRNTHKFHYPDCRSVAQMKESNKWYYNGTRDDLIRQGYDPCKNCNP